MIKGILGLLVCLLLPMSVWAESFVIDQYTVDLAIQADTSLTVKEIINVTFSEPRHGIERKLPYRYEYNDDQDEILNYNYFTVNNQFTLSSNGSNKILRIGNPDVLINGPQSYTISYTASPGITQYSGYQELYRNLIGTQRDTSIAQVDFTISVPDTVDLSQLSTSDIIIVVGDQGSTGGVTWTIQDQQIIGRTSNLSANQGVTIAIKFVDRSFTDFIAPSYQDHSDNNTNNNDNSRSGIGGFFSFIIFGLVAGIGYIINSYQKRQKIKRSGPLVTKYYPPENITPAVAGYIDNDQFDVSDFMATLYDWGAKGYLTISQETESKFFGDKSHISYHKIKNPSNLLSYEQIIRDAMFGSSDIFDFDKLNQSWRVNEEKDFFETIKNAIESEGQQYYENKALGGQKITDEGIKVFAHLRGYRDFIEKVEQDKLKEFLRQDPLFIDKLLPRAVVFGLETKLVKQLEGLVERNQPTWYRGDVFNIIILNNMLANSSNVINQTYQSAYPKSSGGGFGGGGISVGGGGGGGGGGSW